MPVGDKIRQLRETKGISLDELAQKVDIPLSCLEDVEKGRRCLGLQTLKKLAFSLGVAEEVFAALETEQADGIEKDSGEYISSSVGKKIRQSREEMGLTLVECGKKAGISYTHISEIERGNVCPSLKTLEKLAQALGKSVSQFLAGNTRSTLGERVKKLREAQGLTQVKLAGQVGISDSLVAQIESGKAQPSLNTLEKLAEILGVSADYFLTHHDETTVQEPMVVPLKEWTVTKKIDTVLALFQGLDDRELDLITDFVRLFDRYRLDQGSSLQDPLTVEIMNLFNEFSQEQKKSVLDYIKFIASKHEAQANN